MVVSIFLYLLLRLNNYNNLLFYMFKIGVLLILFVIAYSDLRCTEEKCPVEWGTCQRDEKCRPTLQSCQKMCGANHSCWQWCLSGGGSQAATMVYNCSYSKGCATPLIWVSENEISFEEESYLDMSLSILGEISKIFTQIDKFYSASRWKQR